MLEKCGPYLGEGFRRIVYQHTDNPNYVIKFLKNLDDVHNKFEYENWVHFQYTERAMWLAPCVSLSDDGRFLVQEKVEVIDDIPTDIPEWIKIQRDYEFGGNKSKHWGRYKGQIVLIDYGDMLFI